MCDLMMSGGVETSPLMQECGACLFVDVVTALLSFAFVGSRDVV
jgi:hypothetical protein